MSFLLSIVCSCLFSILTGCGPEEPVLARVGSAEIKKADLQRFVDRLPPQLLSKQEGREADLDYLNSMIDQALLVAEARDRGPERDEILTQLQHAVQMHLADLYRYRVIAPEVEITPGDIERAFKEMGFDRDRRLRRILVLSESEAERVAERLNSGASFEELAPRYAGNDNVTRDGEVGWIGIQESPRWFIRQRDFHSLPQGEFKVTRTSPVLWQVYAFVEDREADLLAHQDRVQHLVAREKWWMRTHEKVEILTHRYDVRVRSEGVRALVGHDRLMTARLTPEQAEQPFYSFANSHVTAGDCLLRLQSLGLNTPLEDSTQVVELADSAVLQVWLFAEAARDEGWDEEEEFIEWRRLKHSDLMAERSMENALEGLVDVSDAEVRAYYESHPERFRAPEEIVAREVFSSSEAEVRQWREAIEAGTTIPELLSRPGVNSHGKRALGGEMRIRKLWAGAFPELLAAAFAAREGELVGPLWVERYEGYTLFRVVERIGNHIQPFDKVEPQARHSVEQRRKNELIVSFMQALREKYQDQIAVFEDRLE